MSGICLDPLLHPNRHIPDPVGEVYHVVSYVIKTFVAVVYSSEPLDNTSGYVRDLSGYVT